MKNFIVYDLETHNTGGARLHCISFYLLSKLSGRFNLDLTHDERQKCKKDTIAFDGNNCVGTALDFCLKSKRQGRKDNKNKNFEYNLQLYANNGSGFDTWIVLNNLPCDKKNCYYNQKWKKYY